MARIVQGQAIKGSRRWLQVLINERPEIVAAALQPRLGLAPDERIHWLSPLRDDDYAEYRDGDFLRRLQVTPRRVPLETFWPVRGPQWDGLGRTDRGDLLLVEAKAHIGEMQSAGCQAADPAARTLIQRRLEQVQRLLQARPAGDWMGAFYQYTNRLAHLHFLRNLNGLPAYLLLIYFVNAGDVGGPREKAQWEQAVAAARTELGLDQHQLTPYVLELVVDTRELL